MTTDTQENIRSLLEQLLGAICGQPHAAQVRLIASDHKPVLVLTCDRSDYGAVLGRKGAMLAALERIASQLGGEHCTPRLILDEDGCPLSRCVRRQYRPNPQWDPEPMEKLACLIGSELLPGARVTLEKMSSTSARITFWPQTCGGYKTLEADLEMVFNCAGSLQGQKILVEIN